MIARTFIVIVAVSHSTVLFSRMMNDNEHDGLWIRRIPLHF